MTYVVNANCINCKHMDCVEACPMDCFHEGDSMLVIHPDQCIDCGVCEPECPADAIKHESAPGSEQWLHINAEFALIWPNITAKRTPAPNPRACEGVSDKFEKHFSPKPGVGD
jgi:ferredoxin